MSLKVPIFAPKANPAIDNPAFYMSRAKFEAQCRLGNVVRLSDRSGRVAVIENKGNLHDRNGWLVSTKRVSRQIAAQKQRLTGSCQICGFSRVIESCHIIPRCFGGPDHERNLLDLCPNHHTLFDGNLLSAEEFQEIWPFVYESLITTIGDPRLNDLRTAISRRFNVSFTAS